jgi:hypothetical protein
VCSPEQFDPYLICDICERKGGRRRLFSHWFPGHDRNSAPALSGRRAGTTDNSNQNPPVGRSALFETGAVRVEILLRPARPVAAMRLVTQHHRQAKGSMKARREHAYVCAFRRRRAAGKASCWTVSNSRAEKLSYGQISCRYGIQTQEAHSTNPLLRRPTPSSCPAPRAS